MMYIKHDSFTFWVWVSSLLAGVLCHYAQVGFGISCTRRTTGTLWTLGIEHKAFRIGVHHLSHFPFIHFLCTIQAPLVNTSLHRPDRRFTHLHPLYFLVFHPFPGCESPFYPFKPLPDLCVLPDLCFLLLSSLFFFLSS